MTKDEDLLRAQYTGRYSLKKAVPTHSPPTKVKGDIRAVTSETQKPTHANTNTPTIAIATTQLKGENKNAQSPQTRISSDLNAQCVYRHAERRTQRSENKKYKNIVWCYFPPFKDSLMPPSPGSAPLYAISTAFAGTTSLRNTSPCGTGSPG